MRTRTGITELTVGLCVLLALLAGSVRLELITALGVAMSASLYVVAAVVLSPAFGPPPGRAGWANLITLLRAILVILLAGWLTRPEVFAGGSWLVVGVAALALALDGLDGFLARHLHQTSAFGARFDMETDAALILVLCAGLLVGDLAGPWVLAIGLMRYAFVLAGAIWPWLAESLPPSFRRKLVCVWQGVTLLVALSPAVPDAFGLASLVLALVLLSGSFALDILWLVRRHRRPAPQHWSTS